MRKLICAAIGFGCVLGAWADTLSPFTYIQKDIIAQWDGIDNVGTGTHFAETNAWVDLTGNSTDFTSANLSFADGDCAYLRGTQLTSVCSALPLVYAASTMEVCAFATQYTSHTSVDSLFGCGQSYGAFWQGGTAKFGINYVHDSTLKIYYQGVNKAYSVTASALYTNTVTIAQHDYTREVYLNGIHGEFSSLANYWGASPNAVFSRNVYFGSANAGTYWKAHSIRLYSRGLSDAEVAYNAAVDKVRFRGAAIGEVMPATMPDGYRLNQAGDGIEVKIIAFTGETDGTLSVNGGAATVSNETWVAIGSPIEIAFSAAPGKGFGHWNGTPRRASIPSLGWISFAANGPETLEARADVVSEIPVVELNSAVCESVGAASIGYEVLSAGAAATDVTLNVCYGQHPDHLCYTNTLEHVIGSGVIELNGLLPLRRYYFKLVADGDGRIGESAVLSAVTFNGGYPAVDARQPYVSTCNVAAMPEGMKIRGSVNAPVGTEMTLYYGKTENLDEMDSLELVADAFSDGVYRIDPTGLDASTRYYFIVGSRNGEFHDYYPVQDVTTLVAAAASDPKHHGYARFTSHYCTAEKLIPGVMTGPFSMNVWVRNPRGPADGNSETDYYWAGQIIGNGAYGQSVGMVISVVPCDFTSRANFLANPAYRVSVSVRDGMSRQVTATYDRDISYDDTWHMVTATYTPSEKCVRLYIDAVQVSSSFLNTMTAIGDSSFLMTIGAFYGGTALRRLRGDVAEASLWKKALSPREVRELMYGRLTGREEGLAAYWPLDGVPPWIDYCDGPNPTHLNWWTAADYLTGGPKFHVPGGLIRVR